MSRRNAELLAYLLLLAAVVFGFLRTQESIDRNGTALTALCALRHDIDIRISSSEDFLVQHPQGIPGIPVSLIRNSLANSIRTRHALHILVCKKES